MVSRTFLLADRFWLRKIMSDPHTLFLLFSFVFFPWRHGPSLGQGLLIIDASRSHSDTPHSVRLLWTSDQPVAETLT
jgi:hypothetical protein